MDSLEKIAQERGKADLIELRRLLDSVIEHTPEMRPMTPQQHMDFAMEGFHFIIGNFGIKKLK